MPVEMPEPRLQIAPGKQLERGAAGDHLAGIERQRRDVRQRHAQLAGVGRAVVGLVGLALPGLDHDEVDEDARES